MEALQKQIKESFFNPIIHFLPLLFFVVLDDYFGTKTAWLFSFPIALFMLIFVFVYYKKLFVWNVFMSIGYFFVGLSTTLLPFITKNPFLAQSVDELLFIFLLLFAILFKRKIENLGNHLSKDVPLCNNLNELVGVAYLLLFVLLSYSISNLLIYLKIIPVDSFNLIYKIYYWIILGVILYEMIRVFFIRKKLLKEDWLPIVDTEGKVIGSCQYQPNLKPSKKHLHPVVRCYFIDNGMVLLQQRKSDDVTDPLFWDASVSKHIRLGETIEQTLQERGRKLYDVDLSKAMFLTKYVHRGIFNNQFIHLFVACKKDLNTFSEDYESVKWWTVKQIEDNLDKGVFTRRFEKEYKILQRSGIIESKTCQCNCG